MKQFNFFFQVPWSFPTKLPQPCPASPRLHAADADDAAATCQLPRLLRGDHPRRPADHAAHADARSESWSRSRWATRSTEARSRHRHRLLTGAFDVLASRGAGAAAARGAARGGAAEGPCRHQPGGSPLPGGQDPGPGRGRDVHRHHRQAARAKQEEEKEGATTAESCDDFVKLNLFRLKI